MSDRASNPSMHGHQPSDDHAQDDGSAPTRKVYLHYTQAELDRAYTQAEWAPNSREVLRRQSEQSAAVRAVCPPQTFTFGPSADETLDAFATGTSNAPIHVHLHGGGWRALTKDAVSFPAPLFVNAGATYVALNFAVIPTVRLPEMVAQAQRAIVWLYENAPRFGGDPNRIHLSGHSAGAHMASCLLTTDWQAQFGLPDDVLKSGLLMSGMYDLEPVMLSARSSYVKLSRDEQWLLSAIRHIDRIRAPIIVAIGDEESPEFKRQAAHFVDVLQADSRPISLIRVPDCNHFEMMDIFADGGSELSARALRLMSL